MELSDEQSLMSRAQAAALRLAADLQRDLAEISGMSHFDAGIEPLRAAAAAASRVSMELQSPAKEKNP